MNKNIEGVISPVISTFTQNGDLDLDLSREEIRFLLGTGIHGISPGGSTGEGVTLSDDEIVSMIRLIREEDKSIPIVAGVIRNSTRAAVQTAIMEKEGGADALMVTPISYNWFVPNDEGNYQYYKAISDAADLPIIVYNVIPQNPILPPFFKRLLEIKNVIGIKQSVGGIASFYEMILECGKNGRIYTANDDFLFTAFEYGAVGTISSLPVVFPKECIEMWNAAKNGEHERGLVIQSRLFALWKILGGAQFIPKMKYALSLMGRKPGYTRSPLVSASDEEKTTIENTLRKAGFIG